MEGRTKDGREDKGWKGGQRMEGRTKDGREDKGEKEGCCTNRKGKK